jgi:hypothetical protein
MVVVRKAKVAGIAGFQRVNDLTVELLQAGGPDAT